MVLDLPGFKSPLGQRDVRETSQSNVVTENFNTTDFLVASNIVNLKNKTSYWSCSATAFHALLPDVDDIHYGMNTGDLTADAAINNDTLQAPVNLPNGAVITGVIVYGSDGTNAVSLFRKTLNAAGSTLEMASTSINTEDTTISNATVDNSTYGYFLEVEHGNADVLYGARVTYTTDYD